VVYDSKWDEFDALNGENGFHVVHEIDSLFEACRVVLRVPLDWLLDRTTWKDESHPWAGALEHPMQRRGAVAWFDEALLTFPHDAMHRGTARLVQQGRSFGVTVIVNTQVLNRIATTLLRLAKVIVVLGPTPHEDDISYLERATRAHSGGLYGLKDREVAIWRRGDRTWRVFHPVQFSRDWLLEKGKSRRKARRTWVWWLLVVVGCVSYSLEYHRLWPLAVLPLAGVIVMGMAVRRRRIRQWHVNCEWAPMSAPGTPTVARNSSVAAAPPPRYRRRLHIHKDEAQER
jgi:hypothetical protein